MPTDDPQKTERQVWGLALRALRKRQGKTLYDAATAYEPDRFTPGDPGKGISVQRWGQIEKGQYAFTVDQQRRLARALGAGLADLEAERARILGHQQRSGPAAAAERGPIAFGIPIWGRTEFDSSGWKVKAGDVSEAAWDVREMLGPSIGATYVPDDLMQPKARPGAIVIFDRSRRPSLEMGCVVETVDGELIPRLYVSDDAAEVVVRSLKGAKDERIPRVRVKGLYAVKLWGE